MNNLYISPEFEILRVEMLDEVIMASPEEYSTYSPSNPADWGDPTIPTYDDDEPEW